MNIIEKYIDIIIPAYNVQEDILFRCLSSISCQNIARQLKVTIVDDASDSKYISIYKRTVKRFKGLLKIDVLRYETNGGPGVARQYGIDHTDNDYIMFIDADDTLAGTFACKILRNALEEENGLYVMSSATFNEVKEQDVPSHQSPMYIPHKQDLCWMFGKMYRRSFLEKYDIRFHPTSRANEDNGFNTIIRLLSNKDERIKFVPANVYYWHENLNSITRFNNCQYNYGTSDRDSFYGYVENMLYAINKAKKYKGADDEFIKEWTVDCMVFLYSYYTSAYARAQETISVHFDSCKRFYDNAYRDIEQNVSLNFLAERYGIMMEDQYSHGSMVGVIHHISLFDFIEELKK